MVELKGPLTGIGLMAVVQLLGELHESGRLEVSNGPWTAELWFDGGRLVHAAFGEERGRSALAVCMLTLPDGEFAFVPGGRPLERTLDLGPEDLHTYLGELTSSSQRNGVVPHLARDAAVGVPDQLVVHRSAVEVMPQVEPQMLHAEPGAACPKLGFADDRAHHYSRPTALHRCYASGVAGVVSGPEQRELCLSGQFAACPRFRDAAPDAPAAAPVAAEHADAVSPPMVLPRQVAGGGTNGTQHGPRTRGAAPLVAGASAPAAGASAPAAVARGAARARPRPLRVIIGCLLGLALVLAAFLAYRSVFAPVRPGQAAPVVVPPLATSGPSPVAARATLAMPLARGTSIASSGGATAAQTSIALSRTRTPATPAPTAGAAPTASTPPLVDVRFAAGPQQDWLDNPPFAAWSDGAYRLEAAEPTHYVAVVAPGDSLANLADVVVSATFRKTGGPPGGGYGVVLRDQGPPPRDGSNQEMHAYVVAVGDLGEYGIWRRDGDHWVDLIPWTRSTSVSRSGSPNDLQVRAVGPHIALTVNGVEVATVEDATLPSGGVGVFAGGDYNQVALDRFTVQVPD